MQRSSKTFFLWLILEKKILTAVVQRELVEHPSAGLLSDVLKNKSKFLTKNLARFIDAKKVIGCFF
jgi:hypothetical protein